MEATTLRPGSALMKNHQGWSSCVLSVWGNTTLERFHKNSVRQGQDHRMAWLGRDLEISPSSNPPDVDQITCPGKARTETGQQPNCPRQAGASWNRGGTSWQRRPSSCGLETQGLGTNWVRLKSMFSPCVYILLLGQSFWRTRTTK